jgi:MFS family permease
VTESGQTNGQPAIELLLDDAAPATTSIAWAIWGLFVGLGFLLVGVGLFSTLVGVKSQLSGFPNWAIGVISAAYYGGFLLGSRVSTRALAKVGHIRVFAALASLLAVSMLLVGLTQNPGTWIALRFASGLCIAGQYVVAESWLNQLATNSNRGRLLAVYLVITSGAYGIGQLLIGTVNPRLITGFAVAAILTSMAVAPVTLSEDAKPPPMERIEKVSLRDLAGIVPTGVGTCFLVGLAHGAFVGMGAVYAAQAGLDARQIGSFVAITAVGGVILQYPISSASDQVDRRFVGVVISLSAIAALVVMLVKGPFGWHGLVLMALIGGLSFPLYSIALAYTNDWVEPVQQTAAAAQLIMLYGAGALVGPLATSQLMTQLGPRGFIWSIIIFHALIAVFLVYRLLAWRAPIVDRPWSEASLMAKTFFVPATAVSMSRRLGRQTMHRIRPEESTAGHPGTE